MGIFDKVKRMIEKSGGADSLDKSTDVGPDLANASIGEKKPVGRSDRTGPAHTEAQLDVADVVVTIVLPDGGATDLERVEREVDNALAILGIGVFIDREVDLA